MKNMLQAAEEKRQASLADLSAKHQKVRHVCRMIVMLSVPPIYLPIIICFFSLSPHAELGELPNATF